MAIRIRKIGGKYHALCAAKTRAMRNDLYLNDGIHEALSKKFDADFREMGFMKSKPN